MGAGIAAVAGIEHELSSCCAAIEEAQTELRQELAGRNERRRELEFLEKGGNPLEFQFGESRAGLWSLAPKDPFAKQLLPSDGKGIHPVTNLTKEDAIEYSPEDGSEFKRARSITGKFCFVDCAATTISIESTPPDALPTSISSSIEHDRKDVPKKEFDVCKSNKGAIKGQYARRNRQRSNRFGNGCTVLRDSVKTGAEGGSSSYSSGVKRSFTNDPVTKDVIKEKLAQDTEDQDALESSDADVVTCAREGQEKAVAFDDHPDYDMAVQVCEPLLLQTTHKADPTYLEKQNEDLRTMNQLPSSLEFNVEEGRNFPSSRLFNMEEERNLPPSIQCRVEEAKNSATVGSTHVPLAMPGTEKNKEASDESAESNLEPKSMEKPSNGGIPDVNHVAEYEGISNKGNQEDKVSTNDHMALPAHQSTIDRTQTLTASEYKERHDSETNSMAAMSTSSILESTSGSHVLEEKVHASGCDKNSKNWLFGKAQGLEEVKVKVEDEMPDAAVIPSVARASLSDVRPANLSMPQEATTVQQQYPEDGNVSSGHAVTDALQVRVCDANGLPTDNLPIVALPREEEDLRTLADGTSDIKTNFSVSAKKAHKDSTAHEAEGIKQDSLRQSADWAKQRAFQEPPRKKSHWDFVLEEMAWLANDFMQERLWKIASAAQVARWVVREKRQLEFQEAELCNRQCKIARSLAKTITKFWHSIEALLLRDAAGADSTLMPSSSTSTETDQGTDGEAHKAQAETVKPRINKSKAPPVQAYAIRFLENSLGWQPVAQAEAPPTPDRVSESGMFEFWEDQFPEESLFYTVPNNAMEVYRQSVVSQWEAEYEQRLQEHEAALTETEVHVAAETTEYSTGIYAVGPLVSPLVTGKRSSGFHGGSYTNVGSIPTKRTRTSAVAARQRAAGVTGPLVSGSATHLARSDISSCETNSQQDEMTTLLEGSSVSGRVTDVDSNGAFARNNLVADGVDSPFKSKKKKKTRHFNGGHNLSAAYNMRESEQLWQHNVHRQSDQREHSKHKGEQISQIGIGSAGLEGLGATPGASHGAASVTSSASKLMKQITSRDRGRKYKAGKASLSQPGFGIPWSAVEDQAILRLVYELGMNWELVSDILSSNSQLKGVFRKPKDCKERYKLLTERLGGDGGDSPDDPGSSTHLPISVTQKGGTRLWPQHLEETLKNHVDCILHLHQQLRSRKLQIESQEPKQLVPEHESHASKHTSLHNAPLTPLELCELSSTTGELVSLAYPHQPAHGNGLGVPSIMSSGIGMRPTSSAMSVLHGANNLQLSPSMSPSPGINATATRDAHRMGASMRPLTEEEQRLCYSRMVAGRGLQTQSLSATSGLPLMGLPSATDSGASSMLPSGNSAGVMGGLSRGMSLTRTGLPGMGSIGVPNISASMNNVLPSVGMGLSGTSAVNPGAVSSPVSMMRRPMGHSQSAALNNPNSNLSSPVISSPTQNLTVQQQQQQLLQHNTLHAQQQSPSSSQQQAYNMMRVAKERQQLQQQQQKRMLQQQSSPTSNSSHSPFQSSQPLPVSQQQHVLSPHAHMFSQLHQPSHLLMQQHVLQQEPGPQQQQAIGPIPSSNVLQSAPSPSAQPSLNGNSQNPQQQLLSQAHQPASSASTTQTPVQTKQQHQNLSAKQQQQQQQGKNIKGMGRGASMQGQSSMLPSQLSAQLSGQQMAQGQRMVQSQGTVPSGGQLTGVPQTAVQNLTVNLSQVPDAVVQQYQQKGFSQHLSGKLTPISTCHPIQPRSPPTGVSAPQQQPSPAIVASLTSTQQQQRRASQQSQTQQRRPQQREAGSSLGTQLSSQPGKNGLQPSNVPSQLPGQPVHVGFQLGSSMNNPLSMALPSGGIPLSSPSTAGSGSVPSPQWKPGQNFSPMAAGLYNLSRNNSGAAAQTPHLAMSMGMLTPPSNGNIPVTGNSLVTHEISRGGSQHALGHVGTPSQKPSVGSTTNARAMPASQHMAPSQRQSAQQQQLSCMPNSTGGSQVGPSSSGTTPGTE